MRTDARIWLDKSGAPTYQPATGNFDFPPMEPPRPTRLNAYAANKEIIMAENLAQAMVFAGRRGLIARREREKGPAAHEFPVIIEA